MDEWVGGMVWMSGWKDVDDRVGGMMWMRGWVEGSG